MASNRPVHWWSYPGLLVLISLYFWSRYWLLGGLVPLYLLGIPLLTGQAIRFRLDRVDICQAFVFTFILLGGLVFFLLATGASFEMPSLKKLVFHIFIAAIPEEVYFRGFFQERLGNDLKSVFLVSGLFTLAHMPKMFFCGDLSSLLTFFPSFLMGWLYYKTGNLLHPVVFHAFSNIFIESIKG